ncbi:hypothetical protein SODALDRAFT_364187 [Sodiomyces alkalinus F11]|uniref:Uncharacterized protein n=1 Tax=Sodiomyces alkalinus (strain CBS 110278 / VKM F-3762 / F11) TaxID=1314773 RepID=A0A3N2PJH4_SODAK|nr:hypothetical protein SODALDRAFT_364187 [Sodiomyces alkalinus F11]ROT34682.1 hypothetical protein SODALDRAFT_364187 [Sodiomyces alkalinus F11]
MEFKQKHQTREGGDTLIPKRKGRKSPIVHPLERPIPSQQPGGHVKLCELQGGKILGTRAKQQNSQAMIDHRQHGQDRSIDERTLPAMASSTTVPAPPSSSSRPHLSLRGPEPTVSSSSPSVPSLRLHPASPGLDSPASPPSPTLSSSSRSSSNSSHELLPPAPAATTVTTTTTTTTTTSHADGRTTPLWSPDSDAAVNPNLPAPPPYALRDALSSSSSSPSSSPSAAAAGGGGESRPSSRARTHSNEESSSFPPFTSIQSRPSTASSSGKGRTRRGFGLGFGFDLGSKNSRSDVSMGPHMFGDRKLLGVVASEDLAARRRRAQKLKLGLFAGGLCLVVKYENDRHLVAAICWVNGGANK